MNPVLVAMILAVITAVLFLFLRREARAPEPAESVPEPVTASLCPLCQSALLPGERVSSVVYATKTEDRLMEIKGCPHCESGARPRVCPVCRKPLKPLEVVTARVFTRARESGAKKTHVHVLGCPRCRR